MGIFASAEAQLHQSPNKTVKHFLSFIGITWFKKGFFSKIKMNSLARSTMMARRLFSTARVLRAEAGEVHPVFKKLKATQQLYQQANGLVIHLRAGTRDKAYFYFTTGLVFMVIIGTAQTWYKMAMKGR